MSKQKAWEKVLDRMYCTADPLTGNRACDSGLLCDRCKGFESRYLKGSNKNIKRKKQK